MKRTDRLPRTDLTLDEVRSKLAGWHFSQEALSTDERRILYVAEALLRALDEQVLVIAKAREVARVHEFSGDAGEEFSAHLQLATDILNTTDDYEIARLRLTQGEAR